MKTTDDFISDMEAALAEHEREAARLRALLAAAKGTPVEATPAQARPPSAEEIAAAVLRLLVLPVPGAVPSVPLVPPQGWPPPPFIPGTPVGEPGAPGVIPGTAAPWPFLPTGPTIIYGVQGQLDGVGVRGLGGLGGVGSVFVHAKLDPCAAGAVPLCWAWTGTTDAAANLAAILEVGGRVPVECAPGWTPPPMPVFPNLGTVGPGPSTPPSGGRYGAS